MTEYNPINRNQSAEITCDNCGTEGEQTGERTEGMDGEQHPVLGCPTCKSRWTTFDVRLKE